VPEADEARLALFAAACRGEDHLLKRKHGPDVPAGPAQPFKNVVVGVDNSPASLQALEWAHLLGRSGARITLACVGSPPASGAAAEVFMEQVQDPKTVLAAAAAKLAARGVQAETLALQGPPALELVWAMANRKADLAIVGSHNHGRGEYEGLGGVSATLKKEAPCSILVARQAPSVYGIAAATDGSRPARHAMAVAVSLARQWELPLAVLHAREKTLKDLKEKSTLAPHPGLTVEGVPGPPHLGVLQALRSRGPHLLVIGGRGLSGGPLHSLGSVSDRLLSNSPGSVLVVKPRA
jgi:nucleotide-binding universal stress UspA family protein